MTPAQYEQYLNSLDDEQLGYEFADRIGDELREFSYFMENKGRDFVIEYLTDYYTVNIAQGRGII